MASNEQTSESIGSIAARYSQHPDPNVRCMAMSLLTQRPDHVEMNGLAGLGRLAAATEAYELAQRILRENALADPGAHKVYR
jgi:hypothetical protein